MIVYQLREIPMYNFERNLEAKQTRRMKAEDRYITRLERLQIKAEEMIGAVMRNGVEVFYVFPEGGKYREGRFSELVDFLIRNKYVC
jgi:hypothetical protein